MRKTHPYYKYYGGRGIKVCDEWANNAEAFCIWAEKNGSQPHLQLDRIDNNGNYEPSNCRFTTPSENMRNSQRARFYSYNGERKHLKEWAEILNLNYDFLSNRIKMGWGFKKIIETPKQKRKKDFAT